MLRRILRSRSGSEAKSPVMDDQCLPWVTDEGVIAPVRNGHTCVRTRSVVAVTPIFIKSIA